MQLSLIFQYQTQIHTYNIKIQNTGQENLENILITIPSFVSVEKVYEYILLPL